MHVRPTMLASHDKLWISLLFRVEICETVFIIIMKLIIMIIIMMVIKEEKNLTTNVTLLPRTLTLLSSWPRPQPRAEECWPLLRGLEQGPLQVSGLPGVPGKHPSSSKKLMPLVILSVHCHAVNTSGKTAYFFFLAWSFSLLHLRCNIGINATA